jgi:hypothetical protein
LKMQKYFHKRKFPFKSLLLFLLRQKIFISPNIFLSDISRTISCFLYHFR